MTTQTNDATFGGDNRASDLRVLAVLSDEISLRVEGPRYEAGVQALSETLRTSQADALKLFYPHRTPALNAHLLRIPSPNSNEYLFSVDGWEAILEDTGKSGLLRVRAMLPLDEGAALETLEAVFGVLCGLLFGEQSRVELLNFRLSLYGQSAEPLLPKLPSETEAVNGRDLVGSISGRPFYATPLRGPRARLSGVQTRARSKALVYRASDADQDKGTPMGIRCGSEGEGVKVTIHDELTHGLWDDLRALLEAGGEFDEGSPVRVVRLSFHERRIRPLLQEMSTQARRPHLLGGLRHVMGALVGGALGHSRPAFFRLLADETGKDLCWTKDDPRWEHVRGAFLGVMP